MAENKQITIDVGALHAAYQEALPAHHEQAVAKISEHDKIANFAGIGLPTAAAVTALPAINLCAGWAKFKNTCEMLFGVGAWFPNMAGAIANGRAIITAVDRIVFAPICPK